MGFNIIGVAVGTWFFLFIEKSRPSLIRRLVCE
jgi:hypothetical protein